MRLPPLVAGLSALAFVSACSGGPHAGAAARTSTASARPASAPGPAEARTPAGGDRLPDPVRSPLPLGTRTLYSGSGHGTRRVVLPASAAKSPTVTVRWSCAGPSGISFDTAARSLAGSGCGDGRGTFGARVPRAAPRGPVWRITADDSVAWRVVITEPAGS